MPLFEYRCEKCGKVYEFLVKFSDGAKEVETCSICGGKAVRILSVPAPVQWGKGGKPTP